MNGAIATLLWKFSGDVNIRSVFLHMLGDTLSTAAVIVGGAGILFTGVMLDRPRPLAPHRRHDRLELRHHRPRDAQHPPRRHTPRRRTWPTSAPPSPIVPGVLDVHDLHVWSLGSSSHALASHVTIPEMPLSECSSILDAINCALRDRFHITHTTIQFEIRGCETTHGCSAPPSLEAAEPSHHHHHGHTH